MGNTHSHAVSPPPVHNNNRSSKDNVKARKCNVAKIPENRVLPIVSSNFSQRLRHTDNGNILHNGGTISRRKTSFTPNSTPEPEFVQFLQKKRPYHSENALYSHRKSHSDPDIVRMMMQDIDNDTDDDDSLDIDERYDMENGPNKRSIKALSPSKAKIKSRKKNKAPEPPQANTLPRMLGKSHYEENRRSNSCQSSYEYNETPRRPLPPLPPEELPIPPPPDYNRSCTPPKSNSKNYEKNRRTVDKWKFSKSIQELPGDRLSRQRCKSLDRLEEQRVRESIENQRDSCYRNNSCRYSEYVPKGGLTRKNDEQKTQSDFCLKDAIVGAAKKRSERLERGKEIRNSSFKLSMEHPRDIAIWEKGRTLSSAAERCNDSLLENTSYHNSKNIINDEQHISRFDKYTRGVDRISRENSNREFSNFTKKTPIRRKSSEGKKKFRNDKIVDCHDKQNDSNKIFNSSRNYNNSSNHQTTNWDVITHKPKVIKKHSGISNSISSLSDEEMEIDLQLRPTLPRRPVEISRFSPTDVWKSINLDFFKSHQQRSDMSSDDADDIIEEKICRINRPVAPRRLIHDRSGDSGISPDAGSPMLLNESIDVMMMCNGVSPVDENNSTWIPQHDLADDSESGTDISPPNKGNTLSNVNAKFSMPNLMFPSRSLPRTDQRNDNVPLDREKSRNRGRRRKSYRNSEGQHFNSLRNLKKALGLRSKIPVEDNKGLDPNWSLSRSLPNCINNLSIDNKVQPNNESPELYILDHIRRSNSETKAVAQERAKLLNAYSEHSEWRKSFPGQSSDGHVMYLPEYRSNISPNKNNPLVDDLTVNTEIVAKKSMNRKKFTYQSTVRQEEKKKLEEQLSQEVEERERKRQQEIEWMNKVEEEFRKQRDKEKVTIRHQLRILSLQEKSKENNSLDYLKNDEMCDNTIEMKQNIHYTSNDMKSLQNGHDSSVRQQPTGMKKWLKRQTQPPRPEPEGGRSSSEDCPNSTHNFYRRNGKEYPRCQDEPKTNSYDLVRSYNVPCFEKTKSPHLSLPVSERIETTSREQYSTENGYNPSNGSMAEFLSRTNSGHTFESHSYYAMERKAYLFSTTHFQKELKENVRKKAFDNRTRKRYDSDESCSDVPKKKEPSFSRNHPHRNGARNKSQHVNNHAIKQAFLSC